MEQFGREEGGLPGGEEPNPKRHKGDDPGTTSSKKDPDSKNVVVLKLGTDVFDRNGQVLMPNTIEMGQIKKPEKGQFKSNIKFTKEMTEMDVEGQLRRNFPILRDFSRFCCASAADQRSRLEFHDDSRQLWTGKLIKKRIRGNSALYILTEGTPEPGIASERSENPTAGCSVTDSPLVASKILKDLTRKVGQIPLHVQVVPGASQVGCLSTPLIHSPGGQPMLEDEQRVADTGSTQQSQRQNNAIVQGLRQEVQGKDPGRVETDLEDSAPSQMLGMTEEEFDSAFEEMSKDSLLSESGGVKAIYPSSGPIEGEIGFCITLNQKLPKNETLDLTADFEGIEEVPLSIESRKTLTGVIPRSYREGPVTVTVKCSNGKRYGSTNFTYINNNVQALLGEIVQVKNNQEAFFDALAGIFGLQETGGNGVQKTVPYGAIGTGSSNQNESSNAWSVKVLTLLVYKAAQINGREFLEMIFHTTAGTVVFNHYRNSATLPEDVARANGHAIVGDYLKSVNKRLSKKIPSENKNETIDWLELKHAVEKERNISFTQGTDDAHPASCPDSNDDQSDYDADDETSPFSSPSSIEVTDRNMHDSEYEDQGQITKDDNDAHESTSTKAEKQQDRTEKEEQGRNGSLFTSEDDPGKKIGSLPRGVDNMKINGNTTVSWIAEVDHEATHDSEKSNLNWAQECEFQPNPEVIASVPEEITKVALHLNQEGADPAANSNVASAVVTVAREAPNSTELASEVVRNSLTSHHNQGPIAGMVTMPLCGDRNNVQRLAGPFIQTTTENTHYESSTYNETAQEEAVDCHDQPLSLRHLESDHTLKDKCFGDADTLSSGSSELEDLSSRDKILPNKDDDTVEGSISNRAEERGQTLKLQEVQRRALSESPVAQPSSSESRIYEDALISDAEIFGNQELDICATFDAGISPNPPKYIEASGNGVTVESHHTQELDVATAAIDADSNSYSESFGNEDSVTNVEVHHKQTIFSAAEEITSSGVPHLHERAVASHDPHLSPDDAQGLKNWQPASFPESDYKQSDFKFLPSSLIEMQNTKDKGYDQDTMEQVRKEIEQMRKEIEEQWKFEVPLVIRVGPLAVKADNEGLKEGNVRVKGIPVMLAGQERTGKTSLKKSLKGKTFDKREESTDGIEADPSYFKVSTEIRKTGEKME